MSDQLSLPGLDGAVALFGPTLQPDPFGKLRGYNLFVALLPKPDDARLLALTATKLRQASGLNGECLPPSRLHVSLLGLADFAATIPQSVIDAACAAAASVICAQFPVVFDQVTSFVQSDAFVLRCDATSDASIARVRRPRASALRRFGLRPAASSTPHMTLLYDAQHVALHHMEPVGFVATHFSLIVSHVGMGHYECIGRWALHEGPSDP